MVTEVPHVVLHQKAQRDIVSVVASTRVRKRFRGSDGNNVRKVPVIDTPQLDQISEGHLRIALPLDPIVLVVALKHNRRRVTADDKAAVVIACRVDEMSQNLTRAPTAFPGRLSCACVVHVPEQIETGSDDGVEIGGNVSRSHMAKNDGSRGWCAVAT